MPELGNYTWRFDSSAPDFIQWDQDGVLGDSIRGRPDEADIGRRSRGSGAQRLHEFLRFLEVVAVQEEGEVDAADAGGSLRRVRSFEQGVVVRPSSRALWYAPCGPM